jgi:hypothetical protein
MTFHLTSDTLRARAGTPEAGGSTLVLVPVLVLWLYGTLVLAERRSGYVIMLLGSLFALGMPVIHDFARTNGASDLPSASPLVEKFGDHWIAGNRYWNLETRPKQP